MSVSLESIDKYEVVIGLEVQVQKLTSITFLTEKIISMLICRKGTKLRKTTNLFVKAEV